MADAIRFEFDGFNRVRNNLRRRASDNAVALDATIGAYVKSQRHKFKSLPYPPKLPNQRYRRTGNLANRWAARKTSASRWQLVNTAKYAVRVVGQVRQQAPIHRGRWWIAKEEAKKDVPELTKRLTQELEADWDG